MFQRGDPYDDPPSVPRNRAGFLRGVAKTLAVGFGIAMVPAGRAFASPDANYCCPGSLCSGYPCKPGHHSVQCFDSCNKKSCCACISNTTHCLYISCPCA